MTKEIVQPFPHPLGVVFIAREIIGKPHKDQFIRHGAVGTPIVLKG